MDDSCTRGVSEDETAPRSTFTKDLNSDASVGADGERLPQPDTYGERLLGSDPGTSILWSRDWVDSQSISEFVAGVEITGIVACPTLWVEASVEYDGPFECIPFETGELD